MEIYKKKGGKKGDIGYRLLGAVTLGVLKALGDECWGCWGCWDTGVLKAVGDKCWERWERWVMRIE